MSATKAKHPPMTLARVVEILDFVGIPVVPSRSDKKAPMVPYAHYRQTGEVPGKALFDEHPGATAAQAMMGRPYGYFAIDLDGDQAREEWGRWTARHRGDFRTWATHSGGGGRHLWFRVPSWWGDRPVKSGFLWKGDGPHVGIERLGDGKLVMVPGSVHPETKRPYVFEAGRSPREILVPVEAPAWLMYVPTLESRKRSERPPKAWLSRIPDKIALAQSWGVHFTGRERNGWHECHAVGRDDRSPSAAVHEESGYYSDLGPGDSMGFLALAVACGKYKDEKEALHALGGGSIS